MRERHGKWICALVQMIFVASVSEKKAVIQFCSSVTKMSAWGTTLAKE